MKVLILLMPISEKYLSRFEEGSYYHIYNRCPSLRKMFTRHEYYKFFFKRLEKYLLEYIDIYAYCLIPNHFHLFIRVKPKDELPVRKNVNRILVNQFRKLFISYSKMINNHGDAHGQIF